jgi:MFS family permease
MKIGIVVLIAAYGLSQFYRAFLAVLAPVLETDIGATPDILATASGVWFLTFAAMQFPVGISLDKFGPRLTTAVLFSVGAGGGAMIFAAAQAPWHITLAMGMIGIGCSPVLMASYFIFARSFPVAMFATLAGMTIGFGSLGNIASSAPLAWAADELGWRTATLVTGVVTLGIAGLILWLVTDPPKADNSDSGSIWDVLRIRALWPIFALLAVNYIPSASLRGLWAGPYLADVFGSDSAAIGTATLVMAVAMIAGNFAYGPAARAFGSVKWVAWGANALGMLGCAALALWVTSGFWTATILLAWIGFFGATFPLLMAHGRQFIPAHLTGRGVTMMNLSSIGSVGIIQFSTRPMFSEFSRNAPLPEAYSLLIWVFAALLVMGLIPYLWSKEQRN